MRLDLGNTEVDIEMTRCESVALHAICRANKAAPKCRSLSNTVPSGALLA